MMPMSATGKEHQVLDMASSTVLKAAKKELRSLMKKRLACITEESVKAQSAAIFGTVTKLKPYQEAQRIGIYLSMPTGEVQTDAIVRHALKSGKQVFVPYLYKSLDTTPDVPRFAMEMVDLRSLADYESLKRDSWGIPTIEKDTVHEREAILDTSSKEAMALDMILMPGVAFDMDWKTGLIRRVGHGKGFYDYFLHRYKQAQEFDRKAIAPETVVFLCGLALQEQFLTAETENSVPVGDHDHPLHSLVLGDGTVLRGLHSK